MCNENVNKDLKSSYSANPVDDYNGVALGSNSSESLVEGISPFDLYQRYWFISDSGGISTAVWMDFSVDMVRYNRGNAFASEDELKSHLKGIYVRRVLGSYARGFKAGVPNWFIYYDYSSDSLCYSCNEWSKVADVYFDSKELADKAVAEVGLDDLLRYYFRVDGL